MRITIDQPHGYLLDADGEVVDRFGNWNTGEHKVSDAVDSVRYVDNPSDHSKQIAEKYRNEFP